MGAADGGEVGGLAMSESVPKTSRSRASTAVGLGARDRDTGDGLDDEIEVESGVAITTEESRGVVDTAGGGRLEMAGTRSRGSSSAGNVGDGEYSVRWDQPKK